jgi:hypothetical protein
MVGCAGEPVVSEGCSSHAPSSQRPSATKTAAHPAAPPRRMGAASAGGPGAAYHALATPHDPGHGDRDHRRPREPGQPASGHRVQQPPDHQRRGGASPHQPVSPPGRGDRYASRGPPANPVPGKRRRHRQQDQRVDQRITGE